jgi:hypothetical protein
VTQLVFQHTPKCGGSSVRRALVEAFTARELFSDVDDNITSLDPSLFARDRARYYEQAREITPAQEVVCGHFPIRKYEHLRTAIRATIIRHPIGRTISHYFWLVAEDRPEMPAWRLVRDERLDVVGFVERLPTMRLFYRDFWFADCEPEDFDLVLLAEHLELGLTRLADLVGRPLRAHRENVTTGSPEIMEQARAAKQDQQLRADLAELLADDIGIYEEVSAWAIAARPTPRSRTPSR